MANARTNIEHAEMVSALCKSGEDIAKHLTENPVLAHLWHMASCIQGEAGELFDAVKKMAIYGQPLDPHKVENIAEELGDIEFYLEGFRQGMTAFMGQEEWQFGINRTMTLRNNIEKLSKRYKGLQYSDQEAKERADKA